MRRSTPPDKLCPTPMQSRNPVLLTLANLSPASPVARLALQHF